MQSNSKIKIALFSCLLFSFSSALWGQVINGRIFDSEKKPIFAANIFFKCNQTVGTTSDFEGVFKLSIDISRKPYETDTVIFSRIGYQTKKIPLKKILTKGFFEVQLIEQNVSLNEVTIQARTSLTKEFSIKEMDKISIYMSPVSNGDPLKAISFLPYSTNTSETVNPELRGSSGDVSRVVLNNVPIYNPTRNTRLDGLGNFSVFNTEMIKNQLVYAGNPPLKFGNSIAGLIEINTIEEFKTPEELRLSISLASVGALYSNKINKNSFLQVYGNYQFSSAYLKLNKTNSSFIKDFSSTDFGVNYHYNFSKKLFVNMYSYFIDEGFNSNNFMYNYSGNLNSVSRRNFNVLNLEYKSHFFSFSVNNGTNFKKTKFRFGNFDNTQNEAQIYTSIDSKVSFSSNLFLQIGLGHDYAKETFDNTLPKSNFDISPKAPTFSFKNRTQNHNLEAYSYGKFISNKFILGVGIRKNIPIDAQRSYLSYQGNLKFNLNTIHSFLFSLGKYNGYSIPDYMVEDFNHVSSKQIAFDYLYSPDKLNINFSIYYKREKQPIYFIETSKVNQTKLNIYGLEFSFDYSLDKLKFSGSYVLLKSRFNNGSGWYKSNNNMDCLLRSSISYYNQDIINASLNFTSHPGLYYTPVIKSEYIDSEKNYKPIYGEYNSNQYKSYASIDLTLNKTVKYNNINILIFSTISNLLNKSNQQKIMYRKDYSVNGYWNYQKRIFYFGFIFAL